MTIRLIIIVVLLIIIAILTAVSIRSRFIHPGDVIPLPKLKLSPTDRVLVLAPHPDDEAIGCAGLLQQAEDMHLPVKVVFLTNGDFNELSFTIYEKKIPMTSKSVEKMGLVRHDEAVAADALLGVAPTDQVFLGYPDSGTLAILESHWGNHPPYKSLLTKADMVPYASAFRPGAPYKGQEILADLENIISDFKPTMIFVTHPADRHPDHQAFYLYTRIALWDLHMSPAPKILPYLVHFRKWPKPKGFHPWLPLEPPQNALAGNDWSALPMDQDQVHIKRDAIMKHRSQYESGPISMLSYARDNELFGDFPDVALHGPHPSADISDISGGYEQEVPEDLNAAALANFLGFEQRTARVKDGYLEISITFSKRIGKNVGVSVFLFGYRQDKPFDEMPKLHVRIGVLEHSITDQGESLPSNSITIIRGPKLVTLKVPLELMGDPENILTAGRSYMSEIPLDQVSWRVLDLS